MTPLRNLFDLTGRIALVTGGSSGLGEEIAESLAEAGAALMLLARREQWLDPAIARLREIGSRREGAVCDVSDPAAAETAVRKTLEIYGKIEILVNNAGISWGAQAEKMPLEGGKQCAT